LKDVFCEKGGGGRGTGYRENRVIGDSAKDKSNINTWWKRRTRRSRRKETEPAPVTGPAEDAGFAAAGFSLGSAKRQRSELVESATVFSMSFPSAALGFGVHSLIFDHYRLSVLVLT